VKSAVSVICYFSVTLYSNMCCILFEFVTLVSPHRVKSVVF